MIEPKEFYRKLDSLLVKIGQEKSGKVFLFTIVKEIENTFGKDLHLNNGRIFEQSEDEYFLIFPDSKSGQNYPGTKIPLNSNITESILHSKMYIFDNHVDGIESLRVNKKGYSVPVAFTIHNQDYRWIFVFDLIDGWIREEVDLCLNAVRTALNYRLFSESVKGELEQAAQIQKSLLPIRPPSIPGYQIAGRSQPAELVGGDLFDYFKFDSEQYGFCIGDASGHGIPAALMVRDVVIGLRVGLEKNMQTVYTIKKLNSVLYQNNYSARFISLFYSEMERNGNLFYINAGHPSPLLLKGSEIVELDSTGLLLGALPEIGLRRSYISIPPKGVLVLYTDGILERENKKGEEFGSLRLKKVIQHFKDKNADEIMNAIFHEADEFGKSKKWKDDATVLVVKRLE